MRIGIDIDDTICNTYDVLFPYAQRYTIMEKGKNIENVNRNTTTHMYARTFHNWSNDEENEFLEKYYEKTMDQVKSKLFASEIINKLKEEGNEIYIITARFNSEKFDVKKKTKQWLEENNIIYDYLIIDAQNKAKIAKENNIDAFIDDSIKNCQELAQTPIHTYIMDSIVNKEYENENIKRVYSWPHFYQEILKLKEENR